MPDEITEISLEGISELQPVDCTNKDIHLSEVDNPVFKQVCVHQPDSEWRKAEQNPLQNCIIKKLAL